MRIAWKPAKRRQKDMNARWTKKHGKSHFGCTVSENACKPYKLVRKIKVTTASEHDTLHFAKVLDPANTNPNILADKGYVDSEREERLSNTGLAHAKPAQTKQGSPDLDTLGVQANWIRAELCIAKWVIPHIKFIPRLFSSGALV